MAEGADIITVPFRGSRRGSLVAMRRLLDLEREEPRLRVECYGNGPGEAYQVRWLPGGDFPERMRERVMVAMTEISTQKTLL